MKYLRISVFLSVLFLSASLFAQEKEITIIHTNDLHSHILDSPRSSTTGRI